MAKLKIIKRYGTAPNRLLNDDNLSLKVKGLFTYLQSKPDNWSFSIGRIAKQTSDGKSSVRSAIQELEKNGYLQRKPIKNKDGKWAGYDYILSEKPSSEKRTTEKRSSVFLHTISNKDNSNKDNIILAKQSFAGKEINLLIEKFKKVNPSYERLYSNETQRKCLERLIQKMGADKLGQIIDILPHIFGKAYAPRITTPYSLENKLADLIAYLKAEKQKKPKVAVIKRDKQL